MDLGTGLALFGSAKLVEKLLGPTADYIGNNVENWTKKRVDNTKRIFHHFAAKLGARIDVPGGVPPRVLKSVLEDGSFCDDELMAEYFGGVLASSRTEVARDDRGAAFAGLIGRLTAYQVRTHFFFYSLIKQVFNGEDISITNQSGRLALELFVEHQSYNAAMEFTEEDFFVILNHCLFGLQKESLIEPAFSYGSYEDTDGKDGIKFMPSVLGVELFLWAHGHGNLYSNSFLSSDVTFMSNIQIPFVPGYKRTVPPVERHDD